MGQRQTLYHIAVYRAIGNLYFFSTPFIRQNDIMRDMKKLGIVASILLATVALAQEAPAESPPEPPPPQSFCGFTFGEVYTNAATVTLAKPFRYCNQATIRTTTNEQRIHCISIGGTTSETMSDDDAQTEFSRVCEIVDERFGIRMKQKGKWACYQNSVFQVEANYWGIKKGLKVFSVAVVRFDILEADKKAAKKGAPPLPPGDGGEVL